MRKVLQLPVGNYKRLEVLQPEEIVFSIEFLRSSTEMLNQGIPRSYILTINEKENSTQEMNETAHHVWI